MVIVYKSDLNNYYDKQRRVEIIKYSNGVKNSLFIWWAIYLLKRIYEGEILFSDIVNFIAKKNEDTIFNVVSAASSVAHFVGNIGNKPIDTIGKIKNKDRNHQFSMIRWIMYLMLAIYQNLEMDSSTFNNLMDNIVIEKPLLYIFAKPHSINYV